MDCPGKLLAFFASQARCLVALMPAAERTTARTSSRAWAPKSV
jgi:hypothetical protein